jgi:chorismate mutase
MTIMEKTEKEAIRNQIDALDQELLNLLNQRQTLAQAIGRIKGREGRGTLDFQREEEVLAHLMHLNPGPLSPSALRNIFREIISAAREVQMPFGVAFLGPEATFSHLAALKKFGRATRFGPMATIQEVFAEVEKGKFQYGVVPIENSTEGIVNISMDLFAETSVKICGRFFWRSPRPGVQVRAVGDIGSFTPTPGPRPVPPLAGNHLGARFPSWRWPPPAWRPKRQPKTPTPRPLPAPSRRPCMTCGWWRPASRITPATSPTFRHRTAQAYGGQDLSCLRWTISRGLV